jgi:hypothetical protein
MLYIHPYYNMHRLLHPITTKEVAHASEMQSHKLLQALLLHSHLSCGRRSSPYFRATYLMSPSLHHDLLGTTTATALRVLGGHGRLGFAYLPRQCFVPGRLSLFNHCCGVAAFNHCSGVAAIRSWSCVLRTRVRNTRSYVRGERGYAPGVREYLIQ